ncbi:MAG: hypothetical protein HW421_699 [Ignavibacteria bacterium]|nr:hypothetical protein [Ignavibacteria bacterium]
MPDKFLSHIDTLLIKYKNKGIIIDSNLLIYYFIGSYHQNLVKNFKVTKKYGIDGYKIIRDILNLFEYKITTPNILTEISNLSNKIPDKEKIEFYHTFFQEITIFDEVFIPSKEVFENEKSRKFGLTDSIIFHLSKNKSYLVLTDDFELCKFLEFHNIDVLNYNNLFDILKVN